MPQIFLYVYPIISGLIQILIQWKTAVASPKFISPFFPAPLQ